VSLAAVCSAAMMSYNYLRLSFSIIEFLIHGGET